MVPLALVPALLLPLAAGAPPARGAELYRPPPKPEQSLTVCLAEERAALEVASFLGAAAVTCGATALQTPGG